VRKLDDVDARTKRFVAVVVLAFLVAASIAWVFWHRVEPVYDGKPLTFWAQQYGSNNWSGRKELAFEAEFAVRQIGSDAIPLLLDLMQSRDSDLKKKLRQHLPKKWHEPLHLNDNSGKERRIGAHGLAALGTNAPAVVPRLIELATQHPDEDGRYIAVFALRTLGPAAEAAIPFYIQCLTNQDHTIRNEAAVGLALIPRRHETTFPAVFKYLESIETSDGWELSSAIGLLWQFGTNAKPAVPRLISWLNDPNPNVRETVTNSLLWIDPEAAEKAHVRRR
jgi:HEAT repeat protein